MYILILLRVGLYVSFLHLANARGKTSWHEGLPVVKTIYTYGFHELFLNSKTNKWDATVEKVRKRIEHLTSENCERDKRNYTKGTNEY